MSCTAEFRSKFLRPVLNKRFLFLDIETSYHETGLEPQRVIIERSDFQSSQPASSEAERAIALNQE